MQAMTTEITPSVLKELALSKWVLANLQKKNTNFVLGILFCHGPLTAFLTSVLSFISG